VATLADLGIVRSRNSEPASFRRGECFWCGSDDGFFETGRGDVFCDCQRCDLCGEEPGWHKGECPNMPPARFEYGGSG
jgi:hypothetical protein